MLSFFIPIAAAFHTFISKLFTTLSENMTKLNYIKEEINMNYINSIPICLTQNTRFLLRKT